MPPAISIVLPTISGREHWLERCQAAYCETMQDVEMEFLVYRNFLACGIAWNLGISEARGDYIHLSADDLEPHPGWWQAAVLAVERGVLPCPRLLNTDGTLQSCGDYAREEEDGTASPVARVPFLPRDLAYAIHPVFDNHYMGDYWVAWKAKHLGWETVVVRDYLFTHHMAPEGRLGTFNADAAAYVEAVS